MVKQHVCGRRRGGDSFADWYAGCRGDAGLNEQATTIKRRLVEPIGGKHQRFHAACAADEIDSADAVLQAGVAIETMRKIVGKLESPDVVGKHYEDERVMVAEVFAEEVKILRATYDALGNAA